MEERVSRFRAFWAGENHDRPLVGFTGSYFPRETIELLNTKDGQLHPDGIDVTRFLKHCDVQYAAWNEHTGDMIWSASPLWGLPWLAAILKQTLHVGQTTIWTEPVLEDYGELDALRNLDRSPWLDVLLEMTSRMAEHSRGKYPMGSLAIAAPLVTLTDLRGTTKFALDLYDRPAEVERGLGVITEIYLDLMRRFFRAAPAWHGGYGIGTRFVWAPGHLVEYDEDAGYLLSPDFHRRFVIPLHRRIAASFSHAYLHLHSSQLHTAGNLLAEESLPYLELTPDVDCNVQDLIGPLRQMLESKRVILHGYLKAEDLAVVIESVPPEGLCLVSRVETPEEAAALREEVFGGRD